MTFIDKDLYYNSKGVYIIKNTINNKVYVGSTFNTFSSRYITHKSRLKRNIHHSPHLQNAWNKYGEDNFKFIPLEPLEDDVIISKREEILIKKYNSILDGYNVIALVEGRRIKKHSKETRARMNKDKYKKVCQYDLSGNFIKTYKSMDSTKEAGFNPKCVSECCCGRRDSHKKFRFTYYNECYKNKLPYLNNYIKHTVKDLNTGKIYQTMKEAAIDVGVNPSTIRWWINNNVRFIKLN